MRNANKQQPQASQYSIFKEGKATVPKTIEVHDIYDDND